MSKKLIHIAFTVMAVIGFTAITGCKKGDNDPFLSLRSRKARISGEWKLTSGTNTSATSSGGQTFASSTVYNETSYTNNGNTTPYTEELTIEKDGTYSIEITDDGSAYTISGLWFFAGKSKDIDLKNKEAIVLNVQQYSDQGYFETYEGLFMGNALMIDQLKNKEIIFKGENTSSGSGFSTTSTYDRTYEKQ